MEYAILALVGLVAGMLGGMLGIGGSIIMIPAMVAVYTPSGGASRMQQYQAAAMIVNFLLILPAVVRHHRARAVLWDVWRWLAPAAMVGIVLGVATSLLPLFKGGNQKYMKILFGLFLLYVAYENLRKLLVKSSGEKLLADPSSRHRAWKSVCVGLPMGFSAGLLGIGGGALGVPALQMVLHLPLRNAIATSSAAIMAIAWLGAAVKNVGVQAGGDGTIAESLKLAACFAPTAMIGSYIGGHLTHNLPIRLVRAVFAALMLASAVEMLKPAAALLSRLVFGR